MNEDRLVSLIVRQFSKELSPEEESELAQWAEESAENGAFLNRVSNEVDLERELRLWKTIDPARGYAQWRSERRDFRRARVRRIAGWSSVAAALAAIALTTAGVFYRGRESSGTSRIVSVPVRSIDKDLPPGGPKAILVLADGAKMVLDSVKDGIIAKQGGTAVRKVDGGTIAYEASGSGEAETLYNEISTPAGGQYPLVLEDGTKAWLNANSSIRFPTAFTGKERRVTISGEAYFEVAPDKTRPFHVSTGRMDIEVLGTRFNVKAYLDEPSIKATLLDGKVRVSEGDQRIVLSPAEEVQLGAAGRFELAKNVDAEATIAWKRGYFQFDGADIPTVMRELARWYNVKIRYEGEAPTMYFTGNINRSNMASVVLKVLQTSGLRVRIEGDTIVVAR